MEGKKGEQIGARRVLPTAKQTRLTPLREVYFERCVAETFPKRPKMCESARPRQN